MNGARFALICIAAAGIVGSQAALGQSSLKDEVQRLAQPVVEKGQSAGVSIGIVDETGRSHYFGFGTMDRRRARTPDADTLFELGSITKCFTSILLAEMVGADEVRLDEPAQRLVPPGVRLPFVSNRLITLEDLATYSAGLPRMPANAGNDLAHYSREQMFAFLTGLAHSRGTRSPERRYLYSNLGFALLGQCLADRAGIPARTLIVGRVCKPLEMHDTRFEPDGSMAGRVSVVHDKEGRPVAPWQTGCIAPAGMLRSTARDMVKFIRANVGLDKTPISAAIQLAQVGALPHRQGGAEESGNRPGLVYRPENWLHLPQRCDPRLIGERRFRSQNEDRCCGSDEPEGCALDEDFTPDHASSPRPVRRRTIPCARER